MAIHPTAVIASGARIGDHVEIGPYAVIEPDVEIGDNCHIDAHVKISRYTTVGPRCRIYFGALVGEEPQDHRFQPGVVSHTSIGADTTIREYVTIHRSPFENGLTSVGDHTLLMAFVHLGHDARIGNYVTIANQTAVSGHVVIEDGAVLSGYVLIHQFCRIGRLAMLGGRTIVTQDIAPFAMLAENNYICGPNTVGLRRAGIDSAGRAAIRRALKIYFFRGLNSSNAFAEIRKEPLTPEVTHFIEFVQATSRGMMSGDPALIHSHNDPMLEPEE
ncbi:acyl-ACP--UDP-N-acetylglucosamine O-acyltransferase [Victivallis sp. Marseille-Q1083]|uniref:acyl-ACP--UDP-N-acetylglucosamine O-acyltransferase n=1 Tax=Victivallis sp. Marseille-Q1083 TaxID=2717288 RepID=UPI00158AFD73|nr:acyl-ACP--UDP-N-acetylglucosamine O-acyltransferase [Victivallis sp. Marseille-Q1083]